MIYDNDSPIDLQKLIDDRCRGNEGLALRTIHILLTQSGPNWLAKLAVAVGDRDEEAIRALCHTIGGASANICADELSVIAADMGNAARMKEFDTVAQVYEEFQKAYEKLTIWAAAKGF